MGDIPDFIPATSDEVVTDLSHTLTATAVKSIENKADSLSYRPMVLVLPSDYQCADPHQLSLSLAKYWHADAGRSLLMLVDLKGHKVRVIGSPELNSEGITSDYITNDLVPKTFIPYMKANDLSSAIKLTLGGVNNRLVNSEKFKASGENQAVTVTTGSAGAPGAVPTPQSSADWGGAIMVTLSIIAALSSVLILGAKKANSVSFSSLKERLDRLYRKADELGEASSFIDFMRNERLSHEISDFFAQIETLESAYTQTEKLVRSWLAVGQAGDAIRKCSRYGDVLIRNAEDLLMRTNSITGVVSTYEPKAAIETGDKPPAEVPSRPAANVIQLRPNSAYRVPIWVRDRRVVPINNNGLSDISYYFSEQSSANSYSNSSSNPSEFAVESSKRSIFSSGGGSWGGSSSSDSSSSSSDGGGSWDSGSSSSSSDSSSSSSDGGGSW